ncbi:MAG: DUF6249 domain-containing protein [Candidatus Marinimicrobia bacterium]|jgi:hypothetical protein|nr:DUF6249 domain-containing protein [Candidatus Neomarinimicrobiota bacterium]MDP7060176.1 DUF6249 domain-containing protein [Candidatus Neomarinimicrobiota bacterium]|tara:strand:+ start:33 stop:425 length:393 start_codon:yes stop_codon:yes gene_type:complete
MSELIIPIVAIVMGCAIPLGVFVWQYFDQKDKNKTVLEIAKHMDDPSRAEEFLNILDERKKEPIDYRRGGVITIFVGIGIYLLGFTVLGALFKGVGLLVGAIGVGTMVAGYLYPNTSEELTNAVEKFEES